MSNRKRTVIGNWKMNLGIAESVALAQQIADGIKDNNEVEVMVCPPMTHLSMVSQVTSDSNLELGAQNTFFEYEGAFTGEVSTPMLTELGVTGVIVGHSERRAIFGDTDEIVKKKVDALIEQGVDCILCCGEPLEVREAGGHKEYVLAQLKSALADVNVRDVDAELIIAYEPIWAIGTGKTASPEQAQEMHGYIRELLAVKYGDASNDVRILYGGSCNPSNAKSLFDQPDIDGGLIGSASLKADSFLQIINA